MFHDSVLAVIRKLRNPQRTHIFGNPVYSRIPDMLLGYPTPSINRCSTFTTGQKLILFGRMSKYIIRDVSTIPARQAR
jgi:HK97 family phage major capsid protein